MNGRTNKGRLVDRSRTTLPHTSLPFCRMSTTCSLTVALFALPALGENADGTFELPRSGDDMAVGALFECLDAEDCEVLHLCQPPALWNETNVPADFDSLGTVANSHLLRLPWTADEDLACAVHHVGRGKVTGLVEHRVLDAVTGEWRRVSRETKMPIRIGPADGVAQGWGDCRPATEGLACPDAQHHPDADCPYGDAPWHVFISARDDNSIVGNYPEFWRNLSARRLVVEGVRARARLDLVADAADFPAATGWHAYWRAEHGTIQSVSPDPNGSGFIGHHLIYRAPSTSLGPVADRVSVTIQSGDRRHGYHSGYCASTTIEFEVWDGG